MARENTRKEERNKLSKEAKAGICYLNPPNDINIFFRLFQEQVRWTVIETLTIVFVNKILAFEVKKPLLPPMIFPFTLQRLASGD